MNNAVITLAAVAAELLVGQRWLMGGMDHGLAAVAAIVVFGLAVFGWHIQVRHNSLHMSRRAAVAAAAAYNEIHGSDVVADQIRTPPSPVPRSQCGALPVG